MDTVNNCVVTIEDIEAAINGYERAKDNFDHNTWLNTYKDEFIFALRLAHKVMSEPSGNMIQEFNEKFFATYVEEKGSTPTSPVKYGFKAMINAAIKELENEHQ